MKGWSSIRRACLASLLAGAVLLPLPARAQSAGPGGKDAARLYHEFCSVCHGDRGDGQSRAAANLLPRPRDFTAPQAAVELTRPRLIHSIREGRPGTAMVAWKGQLSDAQIAALADYLRVRFMVPTAYDASDEGRRVYAEYCSVCHGDKGNGVSRASGSFDPPPRNFKADAAPRELTRERMVFSTTYGRANTAMAAWGSQLSARQIAAVVDYIRATFMDLDAGDPAAGGRPAHGAPAAGHPLPGGDPAAYFRMPFPRGLAGDIRMGEALYRVNCVPCHGEQGDGRGPRAYFILPKPRDFRQPAAQAGLNRPRLYEGVAKGVLGSEMPAWEQVLSPQQIADVSEYVFARFIRPQHRATSPAK